MVDVLLSYNFRSIVVATILSTGNSLVDVSHIQQQLNNNKTIGSNSAAVSTIDDASVVSLLNLQFI